MCTVLRVTQGRDVSAEVPGVRPPLPGAGRGHFPGRAGPRRPRGPSSEPLRVPPPSSPREPEPHLSHSHLCVTRAVPRFLRFKGNVIRLAAQRTVPPTCSGSPTPRFWTQPRLSLRSPFPGMTPNRPRPEQSAPQCPRVTPALPPACCRSPPRVLAPTRVMLHGDNRSSDPLPAAGRPSQRVRVLGWTAG